MPCSPRRRIRIVTVAERIDGQVAPGWAGFASAQLDISNGCQDHTVLPYATTSFVMRAVVHSRKAALRTTLRADAAASTASSPAFVTIAIRPSCRERTGRAGSADLPDGLSEIFFAEGLDNFCARTLICPSGAVFLFLSPQARRTTARHVPVAVMARSSHYRCARGSIAHCRDRQGATR